MSLVRAALVVLVLTAAVPRFATGQTVADEDKAAEALQSVIDGSPPPVAPASITRDALGRPTVRAIRLGEPLVLDGVLDEDVYRENEPFGDFI